MNKKNESGRSMVEMLGVLAVIGVLSVAGITGYTTAMRSYRTNEIVNAASMLYVMAMAQNAGNGPTANVGMSNIGESDPSGATLSFDATNKNIIITFNDSNDCTMALNKLGDKATDDCSNKKLTVTLGEMIQVDRDKIDETIICSKPSGRLGNVYCDDDGMDIRRYECTSGGWEVTYAECEANYDPSTLPVYCTNPTRKEGEKFCMDLVTNKNNVYEYSYVALCSEGEWTETGDNYRSSCPPECTPGQLIPEEALCDSSGYWVFYTGVCLEGETRCDGKLLQTCDADGYWDEGAFVEGECGAQCSSTDGYRCVSSLLYECANGQWSVIDAC